ncbi:hypothetical protein [Clostridium botulinum]|uniref:hypothetical protein n=1 Tax=Clostridium botulinum TaxID=1491 RepID=UPI0007733CF5|nr:hypothetical protein [Clostridium botulinum]NFN09417.1 hypothetical protein [Clostridium botulinum]NFN32903.1 hypothetical protein [Clostridium botulinum]
MRKKLKLNIKFKGDQVLCARSPLFCLSCKEKNKCERIETYYYPYKYADIEECFRNDERKR